MKFRAWCKGLLTILPALGLAGCLFSDAPKLDQEDLVSPDGFAGAYYATKFPEDTNGDPNTVDATVVAQSGRSYELTFQEGDHKDAPVILRFLTLNSGNLLAVVTDPDPSKGAVYAEVTHASNGAWVFRMVELGADQRTRTLKDALMRHGATGVAFDDGDHQERIQGELSAANLRALFSDPDFVNALSVRQGFRLSPKP